MSVFLPPGVNLFTPTKMKNYAGGKIIWSGGKIISTFYAEKVKENEKYWAPVDMYVGLVSPPRSSLRHTFRLGHCRLSGPARNPLDCSVFIAGQIASQ